MSAPPSNDALTERIAKCIDCAVSRITGLTAVSLTKHCDQGLEPQPQPVLMPWPASGVGAICGTAWIPAFAGMTKRKRE